MKILLLADGMNAGGAETHVETLALGLKARGHETEVFSCGGAIADRLEESGVAQYRITAVGHSPTRFFAALAVLRRLIRRGRYDLLHAHTRTAALLARAAVVGDPRAPVRVVTVHARFRIGRLTRRISDWGDRTVAVSEDLRAYVTDRYRVPAECVDVIPNGVDTALFCPVPDRRRMGSILFVSRLDADCSAGADLLCSLAPRLADAPGLPPVRIRIAGGGSELERLRAAADNVNRQIGRTTVEIVSLRPQDDPPDLVGLYREADVFVGVSRAAMEAASAGCAVLLCGNEGYGGRLTSGRADAAAGNFCCRDEPPADADRLLSDLLPLLRDPILCRALGRDLRRWMRREFSSGRMALLTERAYLRAMETPGLRNTSPRDPQRSS